MTCRGACVPAQGDPGVRGSSTSPGSIENRLKTGCPGSCFREQPPPACTPRSDCPVSSPSEGRDHTAGLGVLAQQGLHHKPGGGVEGGCVLSTSSQKMSDSFQTVPALREEQSVCTLTFGHPGSLVATLPRTTRSPWTHCQRERTTQTQQMSENAFKVKDRPTQADERT